MCNFVYIGDAPDYYPSFLFCEDRAFLQFMARALGGSLYWEGQLQ